MELSKPIPLFKIALIRLGWGMMALLAALLFVSTATYFSGNPDLNFLPVKGSLRLDPFWRTAFFIHITGGMLCLLIGPFQFLPGLRRKRMKLHRTLGKVYLASILFLGGPAGMYMAFFAEGGFWASVGFMMLSILWMGSAFRAYEEIRKGNVSGHINWMVRSYALTFAAVTLRILVPALTLLAGADHDLTIIGTAWLSWIPNLMVAELLLIFYRRKWLSL